MADRKRCAIYTRKSTEEGLEQSFNSLDAQREACAAYILSQAHEGWQQLPDHYDDGGWSGGNMTRPGLSQLLADVAAGKVDTIVVYKVDRLTRSLADFAKIVETLDRAGASFVSVTQAFNTTNSMGRLTLNVLLSFAQFEREVTSERIRDKIAASKRKGMWMGGPVPIGYQLEARKLVIDEVEAVTVRLIFERYVALRSIGALINELAEGGHKTRVRTYRDGRTVGGGLFTKGPLAAMLKNPLYIGMTCHRGVTHEGEHEAIVPKSLWDRVQQVSADNGRDRKLGKKLGSPSLLAGLLVDPDGRAMTPVHSTSGGKRYRYYISRFVAGEAKAEPWRVPAGEIERLVIDAMCEWLGSGRAGAGDGEAAELEAERDFNDGLAVTLPTMSKPDQREALLGLLLGITLAADAIDIQLRPVNGGTADAARCRPLRIPTTLVRRGMDLKLSFAPGAACSTTRPDPILLKLLAQAAAAQRFAVDGEQAPTVSDYGKRHLWQLLRISWLAPDILSAIIEGRQPADLTGRRLLRATDIPLDWAEQRRMFGFA